MNNKSIANRLTKKDGRIRKCLLGNRSICITGFFKCNMNLSEIEILSDKFIIRSLIQLPSDITNIILQYIIPNYYMIESNLECNKCNNHCKYLYYNDDTKNNRQMEIKKILKLIYK